MGTKVEVRTIPLHGLFIHSKQVWRSLGKLRAESHSTTAQKVFMNEHDTEVSTENADFIDGLKVTPYDGELPKISKRWQYELLPVLFNAKIGLVMETEINIVEILKDKPANTKLYSPLFSEVFFRM